MSMVSFLIRRKSDKNGGSIKFNTNLWHQCKTLRRQKKTTLNFTTMDLSRLSLLHHYYQKKCVLKSLTNRTTNFIMGYKKQKKTIVEQATTTKPQSSEDTCKTSVLKGNPITYLIHTFPVALQPSISLASCNFQLTILYNQ